MRVFLLEVILIHLIKAGYGDEEIMTIGKAVLVCLDLLEELS